MRDTIASALGWWTQAGVDTFIDEAPRDWLAAPSRRATPRSVHPVSGDRDASAAPAAPRDLDTLRALLATGDYLPGAPPASRRIAATGTSGAALMIVTDMPDEPDLRAGRLIAEEAALFDAMLAAMGQARDTIYLAPLSPGRLTGGRLGASAAPLAALMRAQIALVRPRALLLFGDETCRAMLGMERAEAARDSRAFNHDAGTVPAIATFHPRILRRQPACKADAWRAMRRLLGVLAQ